MKQQQKKTRKESFSLNKRILCFISFYFIFFSFLFGFFADFCVKFNSTGKCLAGNGCVCVCASASARGKMDNVFDDDIMGKTVEMRNCLNVKSLKMNGT